MEPGLDRNRARYATVSSGVATAHPLDHTDELASLLEVADDHAGLEQGVPVAAVETLLPQASYAIVRPRLALRGGVERALGDKRTFAAVGEPAPSASAPRQELEYDGVEYAALPVSMVLRTLPILFVAAPAHLTMTKVFGSQCARFLPRRAAVEYRRMAERCLRSPIGVVNIGACQHCIGRGMRHPLPRRGIDACPISRRPWSSPGFGVAQPRLHAT
jgi:hypothetical protein